MSEKGSTVNKECKMCEIKVRRLSKAKEEYLKIIQERISNSRCTQNTIWLLRLDFLLMLKFPLIKRDDLQTPLVFFLREKQRLNFFLKSYYRRKNNHI